MIILRIHNTHNEIYNHKQYSNKIQCHINFFFVYVLFLHVACLRMCGLCIPLLPVYLRLRTFSNPRSIAIRPGASGLPCYCALLVCVPDVIGLLAVWRLNKPKTKNHVYVCFVLFIKTQKKSSCVCISAYAKVYLKTTLRKQNINIILIAGVPSSQALPGFLITATPSVCVSDVLG